ncbi:heme-binding protein [Rhodococcus sp. IEGM 1401]|uniref:SOUL family heme-binding protein n=1 Tax=unclassified Rhodococcus (in: high G+C Gram-positive bacteria) TaxID=192944 RepID=UPI00211AB30C|nr:MULTISPECIES: heme-binding protein [unclassified Rhodococcus (in: high G+C Gram-positive bacteria)]MCZ4562252.1 heme-binding protein [Rhodococcus sp. IEGM 1401]MDI9922295.1 heme-binding protein [Rhodococcus sp. IEGM 1372]MDI9926762.1 heme-binding protein [Rhodococcus sp. IEGM 1341]MDV8034846.1 heme-binding protein [Rhodococcus sp. IEGM 1414]
MLQKIAFTIGQVVESALGVVGIRVGTEEPPHTSRRLTDAVEIRRYEPRIAAQTIVDADEEEARQEGFRRLARYIFGGNGGKKRVAMTAPVSQSPAGSQKIAMTAPVSSTPGSDGWVVRFFMPSEWTMDTLPESDDDRVTLTEVPAETVAVLRFSGGRGRGDVQPQIAALTDALRAEGIEMLGEPMTWFYDPPWTLPPLRRNEVVVAIPDGS